VKAGVDALRLAADAKSITLHDMIAPNIGLIDGDPKRLEQVVFNLISNAVKFTPEGGKVEVRLERANSHVELTVADDGRGIVPSSLPYVFDRFWQETDPAERNPGVGLGLSIVKELAIMHGGIVMVHSDGIGKGCTFTVRLPLPIATAPLPGARRHLTAASVTMAPPYSAAALRAA
jgi:signal transduction histidine kinase